MKIINPLSIKRIYVEKLFGHYTYNIPVKKNTDISRLLIIYGDNGSGKTTILKLLFWLLSSKDKSGYKTQIALTKFKKISIEFANGVEVGAERIDSTLIGSFRYYVNRNSKIIHSIKLETNKENSISLTDNSPEDIVFKQILQYIKELNITVFYLSDDRKILNSNTSDANNPESYNKVIYTDSDLILSNRDVEKVALKKMLNEKKLTIDLAIERLIDWIRNKTISGSRTGDKNSQAIFIDLIKRISHAKKEKGIKNKTKLDLIEEILIIDAKTVPFVTLGLIEHFDVDSLIGSIKKCNTTAQLNALNKIITPYIESIDAKLSALDNLQKTLHLFLDSINEYFSGKEISFNLLNKGLILKYKNTGGDIDFSWLSSGEKQLLLLFINTITSAEQATIFIIDEPEISLNIKWQRKIIETLLNFSSEKNIQYVLSTHSLELISANIDKVNKLEEVNGGL